MRLSHLQVEIPQKYVNDSQIIQYLIDRATRFCISFDEFQASVFFLCH